MSLFMNNHELIAVNGNITSDETTEFNNFKLNEAVVTNSKFNVNNLEKSLLEI